MNIPEFVRSPAGTVLWVETPNNEVLRRLRGGVE